MIILKIKEINKDLRPRERLIRNGVESLTNTELLAILLRCGDKNRSAIDIANEVLKDCDSLKRLLNISYDEIIRINGIKESKACIILSAFELCKRAMSYDDDNTSYDSSERLYNHIRPIMENKYFEGIYVIYLNAKLRIIKERLYEVGGVKEAVIPKERIIRDGVMCGAYAVAISHNHPSGDPNPSNADIGMTLNLKEALALLDIILIDHIIIGNNCYYSFSNEDIL